MIVSFVIHRKTTLLEKCLSEPRKCLILHIMCELNVNFFCQTLFLCNVTFKKQTFYERNNPNVECMDVAVSLGLYISERNEGTFKDCFLTFSSNPQLQYLKGSLKERLSQLRNSEWGMSCLLYTSPSPRD